MGGWLETLNQVFTCPSGSEAICTSKDINPRIAFFRPCVDGEMGFCQQHHYSDALWLKFVRFDIQELRPRQPAGFSRRFFYELEIIKQGFRAPYQFKYPMFTELFSFHRFS